jgi:hypothetical protein
MTLHASGATVPRSGGDARLTSRDAVWRMETFEALRERVLDRFEALAFELKAWRIRGAVVPSGILVRPRSRSARRWTPTSGRCSSSRPTLKRGRWRRSRRADLPAFLERQARNKADPIGEHANDRRRRGSRRLDRNWEPEGERDRRVLDRSRSLGEWLCGRGPARPPRRRPPQVVARPRGRPQRRFPARARDVRLCSTTRRRKKTCRNTRWW